MSSDSGSSVRLYELGDEEGIVEVLKACYPEWRDAESPLDHWKWKYLDNPHGSIFFVADWGEKIVGVGGTIFLNIKINEMILSGYGDDGAVHPDYRRMGIYKKMYHYADEVLKQKIVLNLAIQIHEASVIMSERIGRSRFPFPLNHMLRVSDVGKHFRMRQIENTFVARCGFSVLKLLNNIKNLTKTRKICSEISVVDINMFDERINTFWENIEDDYRFIIERTQDFLNWRYCDPRSNMKGRYLVKQAELAGVVLGFIVFEIRSKEDYSEGYIMDLLVLPGRKDAARKLISEVCSFFEEENINVVHYLVVKNHPYQTLFREEGFIEVPSKIRLSLKMFQDEGNIQEIKDSRPSQIHFNYGDYY